MRKREDAFGHLLTDHFVSGHSTLEVVKRDDGYIDVGFGSEIYFSTYRDWPKHLREAIDSARGRVLDVGCGAGRHALYLQKRGRDVLGIDTSPLSVKLCRRRGVRSARVASATRIPARWGPFDTIIMMGNNFGLLENPKRARWLLKRFASLTGPDGVIIAETLDPYNTTAPYHLRYHRRNRRRGRMGGQVRIRVRYQDYATPWFDYLFVSKKELGVLLDGSGWRVRRYFEGGGPTYVMLLEKEDRSA